MNEVGQARNAGAAISLGNSVQQVLSNEYLSYSFAGTMNKLLGIIGARGDGRGIARARAFARTNPQLLRRKLQAAAQLGVLLFVLSRVHEIWPNILQWYGDPVDRCLLGLGSLCYRDNPNGRARDYQHLSWFHTAAVVVVEGDPASRHPVGVIGVARWWHDALGMTQVGDT